MDIKSMLSSHWEKVKKIYEEGIATGNATFETTVPSWEDWDANHVKVPRLVAIENEEIVGWAALTKVSGRCIYAGVGEVSVYVSATQRGKGIGRRLLQSLISESEKNNYWTLQAGIFPENKSSIKIHEDCGFRLIGVREKIGKMNNVWRDTLLMEKRSKIAGI
ncbi:MAG TPA: GNAT family N-acetyltransferase [Puia sp.]|nr:GNAT family N-acetyltransferase [Puia sp.]